MAKKSTELQAPGLADPVRSGYIVASMGFYRFPPDIDFYGDTEAGRVNSELWLSGYDSHPKWGHRRH